ncbi:pilus assembly protein PilP [Carnimonas bestiolae]|uniref:pilus assembly protein PilP n=1 Tax=Carnimonas bestiolae TaxID=3402172 RepID=UPI003EDBD46C
MSGGLGWRQIGQLLSVSPRAICQRAYRLPNQHAWEWRDPLSWPQWLRSTVVLAPAAAVLVVGSALLAAQQLPLWRLAAQSGRLALQHNVDLQRSYQRYLELSQAAPLLAKSWYPTLATPSKPLDALAALADASGVQIRQAEVSGEQGNRTLTLVVEGELAALARLLLISSELGAWYSTDYRIEAQQSGRFSLYLTARWDLLTPPTDVDRETLGTKAEAQTLRAEEIIQQLTSEHEPPAQSQVASVRSGVGLDTEPVGSLQFRGLWRSAKGHFALLESETGHVYRVRRGDKVGVEAANVSAISAQGVTLTLGTADQQREQILLTPARRSISP